MSWEQRGNRQYYYAADKRNGRVEKTYFGGDEIGRQAADLDSNQRLAREVHRAERVLVVIADEQLNDLDKAARLLMEAAMDATGYSQHARGEWRRRRGSA